MLCLLRLSLAAAALRASCLRWASPEQQQQLWGNGGHGLSTPAAAPRSGGCPTCKSLLSCPQVCACSRLVIWENVFPRQGVSGLPRAGSLGCQEPCSHGSAINSPAVVSKDIFPSALCYCTKGLKADLPARVTRPSGVRAVWSRRVYRLHDYCGKPLQFSCPLLLPYQSRGS